MASSKQKKCETDCTSCHESPVLLKRHPNRRHILTSHHTVGLLFPPKTRVVNLDKISL